MRACMHAWCMHACLRARLPAFVLVFFFFDRLLHSRSYTLKPPSTLHLHVHPRACACMRMHMHVFACPPLPLSASAPSLLDVLRAFPSCRPSLEVLLDFVPQLKPRYYSIACSPAVHPTEIHLAFTVVRQVRQRSAGQRRAGRQAGVSAYAVPCTPTEDTPTCLPADLPCVSQSPDRCALQAQEQEHDRTGTGQDRTAHQLRSSFLLEPFSNILPHTHTPKMSLKRQRLHVSFCGRR